MILYSDNPNLGLRTVTTVGNDVEYRRNCRFILNKFYVIDRDVFCINETWYRIDGGGIIFDNEKQEWILKTNSKHLIKGIIGFNKDVPIISHFSENIYNNVYSTSRKWGNLLAMNSQILEDNGFFEDIAQGKWYSSKDYSTSDIRFKKSIRNEKNFTDRGYNIEDNDRDFRYKTKAYEEYALPISTKAKNMSKFLGNLTFGCELEISQGTLPEHILTRHGIVICRDGSIDGGPELVTVPTAGAKGLQNIVTLCEELNGRSMVSIACAFHVHFGNVPTDKLFLTAFWLLCRKIQDELFQMFPYYKTDHSGVKRKNYNQKLGKLGIHPLVNKDKDSYDYYLRDVYIKIFDFLCEGRISIDELDKRTRAHPIKQKWERKNRYFWANIMNMFFGNRNTLEFRLHGPSKNSHKIVNWIFICTAIIKYAEKNALDIITTKSTSISLKEVFGIFGELHPKDDQASFLGDYLYAYYEERKRAFKKDIDKGDKISMWDIDNDDDYRFSYAGVSGLI